MCLPCILCLALPAFAGMAWHETGWADRGRGLGEARRTLCSQKAGEWDFMHCNTATRVKRKTFLLPTLRTHHAWQKIKHLSRIHCPSPERRRAEDRSFCLWQQPHDIPITSPNMAQPLGRRRKAGFPMPLLCFQVALSSLTFWRRRHEMRNRAASAFSLWRRREYAI